MKKLLSGVSIIKLKSIKKIIKIFFTILIVSFVLISPTAKNHIYAQTLEEQLQAIKDQKAANQKKIDEANKKVAEYLKQVNAADSQLLASLSQLKDLNDKLAQAKSDVDKTSIALATKEQELKQVNAELNAKTQILNNRVALIYKNRDSNILEILFKTKDFLDLISRLKMLNLIANQDAQIVQDVKDSKDANLTIKNAMLDLEIKQKKSRGDILKLVAESEQKKSDIETIYNQKNDLLSGATADKNSLVAMQDQLDSEANALTRTLQNYNYGSAPSSKFTWPAIGPITRPFGTNYDPILRSVRTHTGIDIGAPRGSPVRAAAAGQVIQIGYESGYGNHIMIYHGGGVATFYAHLQGFNCSLGDNVATGQVIGFVGSTGWATGPHLHFEVRINGEPQNPLQFLQ
ncbi:MAG: peptidoglycan DD-metalloendopeptidase family protein [Actinobacteria bacterium]|nr:peptidoglycan DD-metalloendopeptidase family protein [Actinomycetota bacterium]